MCMCVAMSLDLFDRAFWQNLYEAVSTRVVSFSPTPVVYAIVDSVPHVYLLMLWIVGITTIVSLGCCLFVYDCLPWMFWMFLAVCVGPESV